MAYDPYKSLLANASREHLKRSNELNTHLVGNVFLPAIDVHHQKKSNTKSAASLKHLKVIEQCILAENKREEKLAACATIKDRRALAKKFQLQRQRERELIHTLMLGQNPDSHKEISLSEKDVVPVGASTPRQQVHQETTGITVKTPPPDRIFRKADVTGGMPKSKPHAHEKFILPECNGSPGKKGSLRAQALAAANLSSPTARSMISRESQDKRVEPSTHKKSTPSSSARTNCSVRTPNARAQTPSDCTMTGREKLSPKPNANSPRTPQQRARPRRDLDPNSDPDQTGDSWITFEGALSFSEAQHLVLHSPNEPLKQKPEINLVETATQTTPRLMEERQLAPSSPLQTLTQNGRASISPRRPQSGGVARSTRQAFLENLAKENKMARMGRETGSNKSPSESEHKPHPGPAAVDEVVDDENPPQATESGNEGSNCVRILSEPWSPTQASEDGTAATVTEARATEAMEEPLDQPHDDDKSDEISSVSSNRTLPVVNDAIEDVKTLKATGTDTEERGRLDQSDDAEDEYTDYESDDASSESADADLEFPADATEDAIKPAITVDNKESLETIDNPDDEREAVDHCSEDTSNDTISATSRAPVLVHNDVHEKTLEATEPIGQFNSDRKEDGDDKIDDELPDTKLVSGRDTAPIYSSDEDDTASEARETSRTMKLLDHPNEIAPVEHAAQGVNQGVSDSAKEDKSVEIIMDEELETDVAEVLFDLVDLVAASTKDKDQPKPAVILAARTISPRPRTEMDQKAKFALRIQSLFRGYRARIAFRMTLYEDALSCGVLGAMPGTIQGQSGWYLDPKRLMAYYFAIPDPDGDWEQKHVLRCSRLVLTPYEMRQEVLSKVSAFVDDEKD